MTNLTLSNEALLSYLNGNTQVIPKAEIEALFNTNATEDTFIKTLMSELKRGVEVAMSRGVLPGQDYITTQIALIAACHVMAKSGEQTSEWVDNAAASFRNLWVHAKKLNQLAIS